MSATQSESGDPPPDYARIEARSPERFALTVTLSKATHDKLRTAQDLCRHVVPDADVATILDRALDLLVERACKRQFAATDRPRPATNERVDPDGAIPAQVRREVAERDGYRCTFEADDGTRCPATAWLQYDHIVPRALGGSSTPSNVRMLCRDHNALEAERKLGAWVRDIPATRRRARGDRARAAGAESDRRVRPATSATGTPPFAAEAQAALITLGYKDNEARAALAAVADRVGGEATLEAVLREALRAMPPPRCREPQASWNRGADRARLAAPTTT